MADMVRRCIARAAALILAALLVGCGATATPTIPPPSALDQIPLVLARPIFDNYELVGYYELDVHEQYSAQVLAVGTLSLPLDQAFLGVTPVVLFVEYGGAWSVNDALQLDGANAKSELRDMSGDSLPELLVFTESTETQRGDFVVPLAYTDNVYVLAIGPNLRLTRTGVFSSSLAGVMRPRTEVGEWAGQPAIQTVRDLQASGSAPWQPYRVETFVWDGEGFSAVQVEERRRISPIVPWILRENAPWAAGAFVLGGLFGLAVIGLARRSGVRERWPFVGLVLLAVAGSVVLGLSQEWLCVPVPALFGLAGLVIGRNAAGRLSAESGRDIERGAQ